MAWPLLFQIDQFFADISKKDAKVYLSLDMAGKMLENFAFRDKDGNEIGVCTGKQPRQAALKAANRAIPISC